MSMSTVEIDYCRFSDYTYSDKDKLESKRTTQGNFLHIVLSVNLIVKNSNFAHGLAATGGAVYIQGLSKVSFDNCEFTDNYSTSFGGSIFASGYEKLSIANTEFVRSNSTLKGSDIYAQFSDHFLDLAKVSISGTSNQIAIYAESVLFTGRSLKINGNRRLAEKGAGITCINCKLF